jgi:integrase
VRTPTAAAARRRKTRKAPSKKAVTALTPADEVSTFISTWSPANPTIADQWPAIAQTVRSIVTKAQPGSTGVAAKYLRALARHTAARHTAQMRIDDPVELLSDTALAATLGKGTKTPLGENSRRTELSFLRRIRARALPNEYGQPPEVTGLSKSGVAKPYNAGDITAMLTWCRNNKPASARLHAAILLALGCGIDGYEASRVHGTDVTVTQWGLIVRAPGMGKGNTRPERDVPVRAEYERELATLAANAGSAPLLGKRGDLYDLAAATAKTPSVPQFSASRGRATWTHAALVSGATYVALRQAGVSTRGDGPLHILSTGMRIDTAAFITMLRAGGSPFKANDPQFAELTAWSER